MTIRRFTDVGADIVLKSSLRTAASITGNGGTIEGSPGITEAGLLTSDNNYATFVLNTPQLDNTGQISVRVSSRGACVRDATDKVALTRGYPRGPGYIWSSKTSTNAIRGRLLCGDAPGAGQASKLSAQCDLTASQIETRPSTVGKGETYIVTFGWDENFTYLYVDGGQVAEPKARGAILAESFYSLVLGIHYAGGTQAFTNGVSEEIYLSEVVVSTLTPSLEYIPAIGLSVFGDSFAARAVEATGLLNPISPYYDTKTVYSLPSQLWLQTGKTMMVDGQGVSGATICDTATGANLNDSFAGFMSNYTLPNVMIIAGNNDYLAADQSDVDDPATGTAARLTQWLDALLVDGRVRVFVATPGSPIYQADINTPTNVSNRRRVEGIIRDTVSQWIDNNGSKMQVKILPLLAVMGGEVEENMSVQGFANTIGNISEGGTFPASASADDFHPSPAGWSSVNLWLYTALAGSIPVTGSAHPTVSITLVDEAGIPLANLSGLDWVWHDRSNLDTYGAPEDAGNGTGTTDGFGVFTINPLSNLESGDVGWLSVSDSDGTTTQNPPHKLFGGPVEVS